MASTSLVIEKSSQRGKEQKAIIFKKDQLLLIRNSGLYDSKNDDRLGQLIGTRNEDAVQIEEKLKEISMTLSAAEKILKKKKTSFQKLHGNANPHGDKIYLDKILVSEDSSYYQELKKIIIDWDTANYKLLHGAQISKDRKQLEFLKDGVVRGREDFVIPFFCEGPTPPTRCTIREHGFLYLK